MTANFPQLPEFIFGSLSTPEGRLKQARTLRLGLQHHGPFPVDPNPSEPIAIRVSLGAQLAVKAVTLYYTTDGTNPLEASSSRITVEMDRTELQWDTLEWCYLETWSAVISGQPEGTHVQYLIKATTITNEVIYCPYVDLNALESSQKADEFDLKQLSKKPSPQIYGFYVDKEVIPNWLREAVIYQIFVDRFAPTPGTAFLTPPTRSGFYGGTLSGIISKLDYLEDLGVTCLWLTPIFPSPSHHGYDPIIYDTIEPRLGTEADWQNLVTQAHQRGLKIILDYVVNHISNQHPAFQSAQTDLHSPTYSWFRFRHWPSEYDCFFDVPGQPEINSDDPGARSYFINQACQWLKRGADGFRLDYAHGVTHAFWSAFRAATRSLESDSITIGEITSTPDVIASYEGRMDSCLDFKLLELLRGFFAFDNLSVSEFAKALDQHFSYFQSRLVNPSFLDNHDMNRFLWIVKGDRRRLKLAALCQFTLPGPPIIYYGTEVGLSQIEAVGRLEESRLPMLWDGEGDRDLLQFYRQLIAFRHQNPAIWDQRQSLLIDNQLRLYSYRVGQYGVILNNSPEAVSLAFSHGAQLVLTSEIANCWDESTAKLQLQAFSGTVLRQTCF